MRKCVRGYARAETNHALADQPHALNALRWVVSHVTIYVPQWGRRKTCVSPSAILLYFLGSLNHARAKIAYPAWAARVAREKARDNARAVAVNWDMHVFINQLIECEISGSCSRDE